MKIENRLNNIFDQYDVEENRITNALLQALAGNKDLLRSFLAKCLKINIGKSAQVVISAQKEPFAEGDTEENREKIEGIPDGWIIIDEEIAIVFESKITRNAIRRDQLIAHVKRIRSYAQKFLCIITPDEKSPIEDSNITDVKIVWVSWRNVYALISNQTNGQGVSEYLGGQLKEYLAMKEDLIGFSGINYSSNEYNKSEAKFILKALLREVCPEIRKIFPKFKYEKRAVSERSHPYTVHHRSIWSCLSEAEDFTLGLHLTFWLHETHFGIGITIPNRANRYWKRLKKIFKDDLSYNEFMDILFRLRKRVSHLYLEFIQRHYIGMTHAIVDGIIEIDFDMVRGSRKYHIKANPLWNQVARGLIKDKKYFNGQLMIRTRFFYKDHKEIKTEKFKSTVVKTAKSFKEIYDYLQDT